MKPYRMKRSIPVSGETGISIMTAPPLRDQAERHLGKRPPGSPGAPGSARPPRLIRAQALDRRGPARIRRTSDARRPPPRPRADRPPRRPRHGHPRREGRGAARQGTSAAPGSWRRFDGHERHVQERQVVELTTRLDVPAIRTDPDVADKLLSSHHSLEPAAAGNDLVDGLDLQARTFERRPTREHLEALAQRLLG